MALRNGIGVFEVARNMGTSVRNDPAVLWEAGHGIGVCNEAGGLASTLLLAVFVAPSVIPCMLTAYLGCAMATIYPHYAAPVQPIAKILHHVPLAVHVAPRACTP